MLNLAHNNFFFKQKQNTKPLFSKYVHINLNL